MHKILAWDTSQKTSVVVALEVSPKHDSGFKICSQWTMNGEAYHSEKLLWVIDKTLESCGWSISEVDGFGVGLGPGSFTGLRIGLTTARTFSHSLKKPLIGISSLSCYSFEALEFLKSLSMTKKMISFTAIEGAKGQLFVQIGPAEKCLLSFIPDTAGGGKFLWKKNVIEQGLVRENTLEFLRNYKKKYKLSLYTKTIFNGPGWKSIKVKQKIKCPEFITEVPSPRALAYFAACGFQEKCFSDPLRLVPRYLRASYAEVQRESRSK